MKEILQVSIFCGSVIGFLISALLTPYIGILSIALGTVFGILLPGLAYRNDISDDTCSEFEFWIFSTVPTFFCSLFGYLISAI